MTERRGPSYGEPNWSMIGRWLQLDPADDGPFWALNLMRYKPRAEYADGRVTTLTGQEADDAYVPWGPLEAIGAMVAIGGEVTGQRGGDPAWHRIGIVRYPSRAGFFAMQQRDDFKDQHVHKEAGMEFTIVMSCLPADGTPVAAIPDDGELVLRVRRFAEGAGPGLDEPLPEGATPLLAFDVEGVIVGDARTWTEARFDHAADAAARDALLATVDGPGVEEGYALVVEPTYDRSALAESVRTADQVPRRTTESGEG